MNLNFIKRLHKTHHIDNRTLDHRHNAVLNSLDSKVFTDSLHCKDKAN